MPGAGRSRRAVGASVVCMSTQKLQPLRTEARSFTSSRRPWFEVDRGVEVAHRPVHVGGELGHLQPSLGHHCSRLRSHPCSRGSCVVRIHDLTVEEFPRRIFVKVFRDVRRRVSPRRCAQVSSSPSPAHPLSQHQHDRVRGGTDPRPLALAALSHPERQAPASCRAASLNPQQANLRQPKTSGR